MFPVKKMGEIDMSFDAKAKMEKTLEGIKNEMTTIRTGRASASMFDKVRVDYYGQKWDINMVLFMKYLIHLIKVV